MNGILHIARLFLLSVLAVAGCGVALAQEVFIPDPGLNAAVREALQKPIGPLTEQDLLTLTNLNAGSRNVSNIAGLEAARNLALLDLQINRLTNFSLPSHLTNLSTLDLSVNPLTNFFLPSGLTNLISLTLESAGLANLTLPADLIRLNNLDLENNHLTNLTLPADMGSLTALVLEKISSPVSICLRIVTRAERLFCFRSVCHKCGVHGVAICVASFAAATEGPAGGFDLPGEAPRSRTNRLNSTLSASWLAANWRKRSTVFEGS